jgi:hypothetical protein
MAQFDRDLDDLLSRRDGEIAGLARRLVATVADIRPDFTAKVATGWGTVNFRHGKAGFICAVYPSQDHVSLIFQDGKLLDHPRLVDDGTVKRVRWIPFRPGDRIPVDDIAILIAEAVALRA